jgi:hypothetical protein
MGTGQQLPAPSAYTGNGGVGNEIPAEFDEHYQYNIRLTLE